jgi:hypothetical protein
VTNAYAQKVEKCEKLS